MIAASSRQSSVAIENAHRADSPTAPGTSGTKSGAKTGKFSSLLDDYLGDDTSEAQAAPDRRPAHEDKRDHDGQSVPIAVTVLEVKSTIPILNWGLPSRETADANAGSAEAAGTATAGLHGASAESAFDVALPEEPAIQNPQGDPGAADGSSDLAFAARMFESDPQQASQKTPSADAPGVASNTPAQASSGLNADSQSSAETAMNQTAGPATATPGDVSELAAMATKPAPAGTEERRNQSAHGGQLDSENVPGDAPPPAANRENASESTSQTKEAGAARPVEPEVPPAPPVSHDVSLRLADGQGNVDIRMSERGGEIRVMVHTPDGNLANSMRSELPDLVGKLRQTGYQAETWRPAAPPQTDGERRSGADSSPQQDSAGARKDGRQQQQQQQQNQPRWVGEWNMTLDPKQEPLL